MPFDIDSTFGSFADRVGSAPIIGGILHSSFYTAILAAIIIALIYAYIYRDAVTGESLTTLALRGGFWALLTLSTCIILRDKIIWRQVDGRLTTDYIRGAVEPEIPIDPGRLATIAPRVGMFEYS